MPRVVVPSSPDPTRCPLCGRSNQCAISADMPPEDCWCMDATIAPAVLASIPKEALDQSCLCPACAARQGPDHPCAPI
ncbi:cysteine-rich CWC family protein [Comamonas endophytica]|uniref:Cysteine-rich CWC family protein n=2 Tax=Comamonas endophytica TaxID=2949090 RepID=A0ABY6G775_9BURK|nr:cysteine-rich CWC family protein [Acidovorax sp. D4N7]UYG50314.1 cysteine-rich CWC family protein [Acidovorax sp. 5MLIR]